MDFGSLLIAIQQMSPIEAMLVTIVVIYAVYRGGINLVLPLFKRRKAKRLLKGGEADDASLIDIHRNCKNFASFGIILEKVMEKSDKIFRIKYQETLYEQMNEAELMWDDARDTLKTNFAKTYDKHNHKSDKVHRMQTFKLYEIIIDSLEVDMVGIIRKWLRKNHFLEKSELQYAAYAEEKASLLLTRMTRLFDDKYDEERMHVKREALRETMTDNALPAINKRIGTFFLRVRAIAFSKEKEIADVEASIEKI